MKNNFLLVFAVIVILGGVGAYLYWPQIHPEPAQVQAPLPAPPATALAIPEVRREIETPPAPALLPALADSDKFILDALASLVANKTLMDYLHTDRFIRHFVATIDNLPGKRAPMSVMPVEHAPGMLITAGAEDELTISADNAIRYTPYARIAKALDAGKLVGLYVRLYPLFQQAYQELGYPGKYFNDRLVVVIDDLLAAPVLNGPVKLVRPNVLYQYAEPDLERRSIGQRILMRIGGNNEAIIKSKLGEIRKELLLHMHEKKVG